MWDLTGKRIYTTARGYLLVYLPEHPNARNGCVLLHRVVMETVLGRLLTAQEHVHHKNEDKSDNRPENLDLIAPSDHARHHATAQVRPAAQVVELTCARCKRRFTRLKRQVHPGEPCCSR